MPTQAAVHYVHPIDNLHIVLRCRMCRALQEMHTAHYGIELPLQFQRLFVFDDPKEMRVVQVVQRSQSEVS